MEHIVEAVYEDGVLKLTQPLPLKDRERVRVKVESLSPSGSVLDIRVVSLGTPLPAPEDDLLGDMLESRE